MAAKPQMHSRSSLRQGYGRRRRRRQWNCQLIVMSEIVEIILKKMRCKSESLAYEPLYRSGHFEDGCM